MNKLTAEKCREQFEAHIRNLDGDYNLIRVGEVYIDVETQIEWRTWQASWNKALEIALPILEQQERGCESCGGNRHVEIDHGELGIEHMICDKCIVTPEQQERCDEWIEWGGGERPVGDCELVVAKLRDGTVLIPLSAGHLAWWHDEPGFCNGRDMIAYRIIPEQPTNQNGEQ